MDIEEKNVDQIKIISIKDRLDAYNSNKVERYLNNLIESGVKQIIVDMEGVEYISSSGLRVMLSALKNLKKKDGILKLACLQPYVLEVFEIAGFTQIFEIYNTVEEAVSSF